MLLLSVLWLLQLPSITYSGPGVKVCLMASMRVMFHWSTWLSINPLLSTRYTICPAHGSISGRHGSLRTPEAT